MKNRLSFTPGPWRIGKNCGCVVSDQPAPGIRGSDDVEYYGGHMICESVSIQNAKLIVIAPEMYELLRFLLNDNQQIPAWLWDRIQEVLSRV